MGDNILLVLSTHSTSDRAIDYAVRRAAEEGRRLVAFFLLESELAEEASERFSDIGFTGDRPTASLTESLMREYRQRGYEALGRVQIKAMEAGVDFEPLMGEGPYVSTILGAIESHDIGLVVIQKRKKEKSLLSYFRKGLSQELKEAAPCEVVIIGQDNH